MSRLTKISAILGIVIISFSIFYYLAIFLPHEKKVNQQRQAQKVKQLEMLKKERFVTQIERVIDSLFDSPKTIKDFNKYYDQIKNEKASDDLRRNVSTDILTRKEEISNTVEDINEITTNTDDEKAIKKKLVRSFRYKIKTFSFYLYVSQVPTYNLYNANVIDKANSLMTAKDSNHDLFHRNLISVIGRLRNYIKKNKLSKKIKDRIDNKESDWTMDSIFE